MAENQEKRTLKSITKTAKYHVFYMGNIIVVSLGLVFLLYLMIIQKIIEVVGYDDPVALRDLVLSVSVGAILVAASVTFVCLLTAHRISGVHIKLKNTFGRIKDGDLDARLYFRKGDRLEDVERSFNDMLETLLARIDKENSVPSKDAE